MSIVLVFPNEYANGKAWGTYFIDLEHMRLSMEDGLYPGVTFEQVEQHTEIEGIRVYHVKGFNPSYAEYREALRAGFISVREHEHARQLDHSWEYDAFMRGEMEDESGMYQRQRNEHWARWKKINGALTDYLNEVGSQSA